MMRRKTAQLLVLALGLNALVMLAIACAPAAPGGQDGNPTPTPTIWIIDDTSPSELATAMAQPTATSFPPGYVRPTDVPYTPPLTDVEIGATLAASMATEAAQQARGAAAVAPTPSPTPTPSLTEQVTQFAREMQSRYDMVARVRAGASRRVSVPDGVTWPHNQEPIFKGVPGYDSLVRTTVTAVTVYYGTLPSGYELVSHPGGPNATLDTDQEYVLFISKTFVRASEYPEAPHDKFLYNQTQLDAIGGEGGGKFARQAWIVDGDRAWQIPVAHFSEGPTGSDLAAARAGGASLSLSDLEAAIRAGLPQ